MLDKFTEMARKSLSIAREEARDMGHDYIGTEHVLLGIMRVEGVAKDALEGMSVHYDKVKMEVVRMTTAASNVETIGELPLTPRLKQVLAIARKEASSLSSSYIGTEHILLGILQESEGLACSVLNNLGVNIKEVKKAIMHYVSPGKEDEKDEKEEADSSAPTTKKEKSNSSPGRVWPRLDEARRGGQA